MNVVAAENTRPGRLMSLAPGLEKFLGSDPDKLAYIAGYESADFSAIKQNIRVGVIDSGLNPKHPQLVGKVVESISFTESSANDTIGHGTAVAIIASLASSTKIYSAKVTNDKHEVLFDAVMQAVDWMAKNKPLIVNMSLGFDPSEPRAQELCRKIASLKGTLFIVAAGNRGPDQAMIPASCKVENVLSIASPEKSSGQGDVTGPLPFFSTRSTFLLDQVKLFLANKKISRAVPMLEVLYDVNQDNPELGYLLASAYFHIGATDKALLTISNALSFEPNMEKGVWLQAISAANLARRKFAISKLEHLLLLNPRYPVAAKLLVFLKSSDNVLPESLKIFFEQNR